MRPLLKYCLNLLYFGHTNEISSEVILSVLIPHVLSDHAQDNNSMCLFIFPSLSQLTFSFSILPSFFLVRASNMAAVLSTDPGFVVKKHILHRRNPTGVTQRLRFTLLSHCCPHYCHRRVTIATSVTSVVVTVL